MTKVLLLTRYSSLGASTRLRSLQYLPSLSSSGFKITVSPLLSNEYLQSNYDGKYNKLRIIKAYFNRIRVLMGVCKYDIVWIEKELFPFMPAIAEYIIYKLRVNYIVDYDDAIFHRYDQNRNALTRHILGGKIDSVMKMAALVIVGNGYLANRAKRSGAKSVEIAPTVVDLDRYKPELQAKPKESQEPLVIGWIGSPSTQHYLFELQSVFLKLSKEFNLRIVAVGARDKRLTDFGIEIEPWHEATEVNSIRRFDIGIMPLKDRPWERGKCGYKLIQYMACNLPVVASAVGVNKVIVEHGCNGYLANDLVDWERFLRKLLMEPLLRAEMGNRGRSLVESNYSLQVQAPRLQRLMQQTFKV